MADNIKIVGEILNTQEVPRYNDEDIRLLSPILLKEDFGKPNDYIEYYVYDIEDNLLNVNYNYKNFKSPSTSYVDPINESLPIIEIDPIKDLQDLGYSSGEFRVQYNLFNNTISDANQQGLFLKEISADRTEIRIGSTILTNEQIESGSLNIINSYSGSNYFVDYIINFGDNTQAIVVNTALNKVESGYEILFKLYEPLPDNVFEKVSLWVVKEKVNPYVFEINLDRLVIAAPGPKLRGPNFAIDIPNQNNIATSYQTYNDLVNSINSISSASYQQFLSLITSQSIDINTDYTNFNNFVFFSSAKKRVENFYNKVKDIEDYKTFITTYTPFVATTSSLQNTINQATASINDIIANFDGFEYYLYFESGSTLTSSLQYNITPYPKSGSIKPFNLFPTSSISASIWFSWATENAEYYDNANQNKLTFTVPNFIQEDENNKPYLNFLDMVGHYFDNIWIFLQAVTDINLANNNLEQGVSKDLVYSVLESLGIKLYNQYGNSDNLSYLIGSSGSINFDNNFTYTGSYLNSIPRKDLVAESYKRIYHNLPLLLKTKGTSYGLQTLISTFGLTSSLLPVKEYGGDLKSNLLDEFNNDKVRVVSSSLVTGSILSPHIRLIAYPTASSQFRINDQNYVDISFSPQDKIDIFTSASIVSANPTWNIDDYIGDPGYLYSSSYAALETQRLLYLSPLSASLLPFTGSLGSGSLAATDYNSFIRLVQFFDNSLFKMLKDFVPARTSLSTGITISSPILERNKWSYANPSSTTKTDIKEGTIEGPIIGTEYTNLYNNLTGSKVAYYDGNLNGSNINVYSYFASGNINPYLTDIDVWNLQNPNKSIDLNKFAHSDFNVLFNNVSKSRDSLFRKKVEPIYVINSPLSLAGYSSSYDAELQDSYLSLRSYQLSRYEGVKLTSLKYNTYTSASYTGSNGITVQTGDISYGKTAAIDKTVNKIGLFTDIKESPYLRYRNNVSLKYLVDDKGGLTELNERNKNWEDIQRTFIMGDTLDVSLFNVQNNQKTTNGTKPIFDSGYSYYPILYFSSCSSDPKIYFETLGTPSGYRLEAINGFPTRFIYGSSNNSYPIVNGNIYNIFETVIEGESYYTPGSTVSQLFPTYSVQESGDYKAYAGFFLRVQTPVDNELNWSLALYKNNTLIEKQSKSFNFKTGLIGDRQGTIYKTDSSTNNIFSFDGFQKTITSPILDNNGNILVNAGTTLYGYSNFYSQVNTSNCSLSGGPISDLYSTAPSLNGGLSSCTPPPFRPASIRTLFYSPNNDLFIIPNLRTSTVGGDVTQDINVNLPLIQNLAKDDKIVVKFTLDSFVNPNFTASIDQNSGLLAISSLAVQTGAYPYATCRYFDSGAIDRSVSNNDRSTLTFSKELSNFHNRNYIFVPNPFTGSAGVKINSLYPIYKEVDYPFTIKPRDIIVTHLSDGTYIESRITNVATSASLLQVTIDTPMANLQVSDYKTNNLQKFLVLTKREDETNAYVTFRKREGSTSYGFVIPSNISPTFLSNIDTITREVKQRLINEQAL